MNTCSMIGCNQTPMRQIQRDNGNYQLCWEHYAIYLESLECPETSPLTIKVSAESREFAISKIQGMKAKINTFKCQLRDAVEVIIENVNQKAAEVFNSLEQANAFLDELIERVNTITIIPKNSYIYAVDSWLINSLEEYTRTAKKQFSLVSLNIDINSAINLDFVKFENRLQELLKYSHYCQMENPEQNIPMGLLDVCFECQARQADTIQYCGHKYCNECFRNFRNTCPICPVETNCHKIVCENCKNYKGQGVSQCEHALCTDCSYANCALCEINARSFLCEYARHKKDTSERVQVSCGHQYCSECLADTILTSHLSHKGRLECGVCLRPLTKDDVGLVKHILGFKDLLAIINKYFPENPRKYQRLTAAHRDSHSSANLYDLPDFNPFNFDLPNRDSGSRNPPNRDSDSRNPPNRDAGSHNPPNRDSDSRNPPNRDAGSRNPPNRDASNCNLPHHYLRNLNLPDRYSRNLNLPNLKSPQAQTPR